MRRTAVLALSLSLMASPASAETWLCLTEKSTGFGYDAATKNWRSVDFGTTRDRYIVAPSTKKDWVYEVRRFGTEKGVLPDAWCKADFAAGTFLHCTGVLAEFKFNRKTGRFLKSYLAGYWTYAPGVNETQEGGDTPSIEIGTCSAV